MMKKVVGLCAGRHDLPVEGYIFNREIDPTDTKAIEKVAFDWVVENCAITRKYGIGLNQADNEDVKVFTSDTELVLYVTGLTIALAAVIKACMVNGVMLTLMHYNRELNDYFEQIII